METHHDHEEGLFLNLPSPIIDDIFSRLPATTIFRCKSVCKAFLKLISDPKFVSLHHARSPVELLINNHSSSEFPGFSCLNLVEIEDDEEHHNLHYVAEKKMKVPKVHPHSNTTLIGSINGLVCINNFHYHEAIHIWNPTTREYITLETPNGERVYPNIVSYGFGFSSMTSQFHVVRIFQERNKNDYNKVCKSECHVYTLGTGSWRSIGHAPFLYNCREHGVFLHNKLHWRIRGDDEQQGFEFISCLDLEKLRFKALPSPSELARDNLATLNTYNDRLCVCDNTSDFDIVVWTMKEYGIKNSWCKEAVISKYPIDLIGNYYEVVHVIKVFKDGEILLLWRDDLFLSYNLERKKLTSFDAKDLVSESREHGLPPCIDIMEYVSCVLSLKNFEMETVKKIQ